jgi:hypothetical protein
MLGIARRALRRGARALARARDRRRLAPLYAPDPNDRDADAHIRSALAWLERAQDAGADRGVSYGVRFGGDFAPSYPETTGYICRTFVRRAEATGDHRWMERAVAMGHWEADIQLPDGAVMAGTVTAPPVPAVFNTGMVLLGWAALIESGADGRFRNSCQRAGDWLVRTQEPNGEWRRGHSPYAVPGATAYAVYAAAGLCEAGRVLENATYVDAALRNAQWCLGRQDASGMFRDCCVSDPTRPLLHAQAYAIQGLIDIGRRTGRRDFIAAARRAVDAYLCVLHDDGFIAGRHDAASFSPRVSWSCLTGSAQLSVACGELFLLTGDGRYRDAMTRLNRYLMAHHDSRNPDPRLRGGVPGAWPTWGDYGRLMVLNWATSFLVDALVLEQQIAASAPPARPAALRRR